MMWYLFSEKKPEPGKRVLFGCENGFVCEGFMCFFWSGIKAGTL